MDQRNQEGLYIKIRTIKDAKWFGKQWKAQLHEYKQRVVLPGIVAIHLRGGGVYPKRKVRKKSKPVIVPHYAIGSRAKKALLDLGRLYCVKDFGSEIGKSFAPATGLCAVPNGRSIEFQADPTSLPEVSQSH